jgi:nucleoside phosphorylase/CheY-like chemotaxis protein
MIRTLIIEDSEEKRTRIARALSTVESFDMDSVDYVSDIVSAKRSLSAHMYDVAVLDIALPLRADSDVSSEAGIDLINEILLRPSIYQIPEHIIGITAYEEVFLNANSAFSSRLLTLIKYEAESDDWIQPLQARIRHISESRSARAQRPSEYKSDLAVICALESPELAAIRNLPWNWHQLTIPGDHTIYWRGNFEVDGMERVVYAACCANMGMPAAAVLSSKLIYEFRPKYLVMTGVTAGVIGRVQLGDVLVADPCWDSGSGKIVSNNGSGRFLPAPHQISLSVDVREKLKLIASDHALLADIRAGWPAEKPPSALEVHIGPVASGASVLADSQTLDRVIEQHRQLLGFEMEVYGVFAAADEFSNPRPTPIAIKAVVDFANGEKNDQYKSYCGYSSAQVLRHLCERYLFPTR